MTTHGFGAKPAESLLSRASGLRDYLDMDQHQAGVVNSAQVEPKLDGPLAEQADYAQRLLDSGAPPGKVAAAWRALLDRDEFVAAPRDSAFTLLSAGGALIKLAEADGDPALLNRARSSLELAAAADDVRPLALSYQGVAWGLTSAGAGKLPIAAKAVQLCHEALQACSPEYYGAPVIVFNLGLQVARMYHLADNPQLLGGAIGFYTEAARVTRPGSYIHRWSAVALAELHLNRYQKNHQDEDLDSAGTWAEHAMREMSRIYDRLRAAEALVAARRARYLARRDRSDLHETAMLLKELAEARTQLATQQPVTVNAAQ